MKSTIIYCLLSVILLTQLSTAQAQTRKKPLENVITDYTQQISKNWRDYKLTEYFSKKKPDFHYLDETFGQPVVSDSTNIEFRNINVSEIPDSKGVMN